MKLLYCERNDSDLNFILNPIGTMHYHLEIAEFLK